MPPYSTDIKRWIDLNEALDRKSCFLFGPRQTGKSWLIRHALRADRVYNLLDSETFLRLNRSPQRIREECGPGVKRIVVDEIQKLPSLLDEIHLLIEERGVHFLLTGSSARKLRRGGVNLLGGRARTRHLHPLTFGELKDRFDLLRALNNGLLPSLYFSDSPDEDLEAYVGTYLKEEIAAEGLTRNIPAFSRFLEVAALCNGRILNFSNIANDAQTARSTVHEYFQVLKDTLIGYELPAWRKSKKRKPLSTSKLYFFDPGVARFLQNRGPVRPGSPEFGDALETFLFHELKSFADYHGIGDLSYWRSTSGFEVDFILAGKTAVEVKAKKNISARDLAGLKALQEEKQLQRYLLVCMESTPRTTAGIEILPLENFLGRLWAGEFH
ncbi:MAG: ATP-binding protein [Candidatus Omnitrophica bacterium]|nr:ATP-binding protein [Candidatus Omnitrophota bacterium]